MNRKLLLFHLYSRRFYNTYLSKDIYKNPCLNLSQYLEISFLKDNEICFTPTIENMNDSLELFEPKRGHLISKIANAIHPEKFPEHDLPEVALIGRSNVGKSSLLKAIFSQAPDLNIKTSKKAGHTKSLQFFNVGKKLCLVDTPGYGEYQPEGFETGVKWYLKKRKNLKKIFFLIDGKKGFQAEDEIGFHILEDFRVPYVVVMTKIDMSTDSERLKNYLHIQDIRDQYASVCCFPQIYMLSSSTGEGIAHFLAFMAHITGNLPVAR